MADKVGISPWEIRYRNAIRPGGVLPNGQIVDGSTGLVETLEAVKKILAAKTSAYWEEHFNFRKVSPRREKRVGDGALNLIAINTVIPFLYAYGLHKADDVLCDRATRFLESLKAENNHVTRLWDGAGLPVSTAADSQALLQLQKEYCDKKDCLRCRFGYEYLKHR